MTQDLDRQREAIAASAPAMSPGVEALLTDWGQRVEAAGASGDLARAGAAALDGVRAVVAAMSGDDARYVVVAGEPDGNIGQTNYTTRTIHTTTAPLADERLTWRERFGVMVAIAMHEAGHARLTGEHAAMLGRVLRNSSTTTYAERRCMPRLGNVASDVSLETLTQRQWPGYAGVFDLAMWWAATRHGVTTIDRMPGGMDEALNLVSAVARYSHLTAWGDDPDLTAERRWWEQWVAGCVGLTPRSYLKHLRVGVEHLQHLPGYAPQPEQDEGGDQPGGSTGGEQGEPGQPGQPSDEPQDGEAGAGASAQPDPDADSTDSDGSGGGSTDEADDEAEAADGEGSGTDGDEQGDEADEADEQDGNGGGTSGEATGDSTPNAPGGHGERTADEAAATKARDGLRQALPEHPGQDLTADEQATDAAATALAGGSVIDSQTVEVRHSDGEVEQVRINGLPWNGHGAVALEPSAVAAMRRAIADKRTQPDSRTVVGKRGNRLSPKHIARVAAGRTDVLMRRDLPGPARIDLHLLIDGSGSMMGGRIQHATAVAAAVAGAMRSRGDGRTRVWSFASGPVIDVYDSRRSGDSIDRLAAVEATGGTHEATAVAVVSAIIQRERQPNEASVLVVIADGAPGDLHRIPGAVAEARKAGIAVISVAIAHGMTAAQRHGYGEDAMVEWHGDWHRLAKDMGEAIGRATAR